MILQACVNSQLRELNLCSTHLKDDVTPAFSKYLAQARTIRVLNLSGNDLTVRFTSGIAEPLGSSTTLEELDLSNNPLGGRGLAALGPAVTVNSTLRVLSARRCKIEAHGFAEFCNSLRRNTSLVQLDFAHNPLRDEGSAAFAQVLAAHPTLHDVDFELCEIGDGGSEALFPALAQSPTMGRFSVKNNLIRGGLVIQKAVADNPRLLALNVEFNDIDFKVFTEIQRLVRVNRKVWRDGQKDRIRQAVIDQAEAEVKLREARCAIRDERTTIAFLEKKKADTIDLLHQAEDEKAEHLANLEQQLNDLSDLADAHIAEQREEANKERGRVAFVESEFAVIANKNDRELSNFQRECKALRNVEGEIREIENQRAKGRLDWSHMLMDTKAKYRDVRDAFLSAHQKVMDNLRMAQAAEAAAKLAAEAAERKARKQGKRKGRGRKTAQLTPEQEGENPPAEGAEPAAEGAPQNPPEEEKPKVEPPKPEILIFPIREPPPRPAENPPEAVAPAAVPAAPATPAAIAGKSKTPKIAKPKTPAKSGTPQSARRAKKD
jgi:hypothetical protein